MGYRFATEALKDFLETHGYERRVFEWGYEPLEAADSDIIIILKFGGMEEEIIDTYGPTYHRPWLAEIEVHSHLEPETEVSHVAFTEVIDDLVDLLEKWPHLGKGQDSVIHRTDIVGISNLDVHTTEEGTFNWIGSTIVLRITEESPVAEME